MIESLSCKRSEQGEQQREHCFQKRVKRNVVAASSVCKKELLRNLNGKTFDIGRFCFRAYLPTIPIPKILKPTNTKTSQ